MAEHATDKAKAKRATNKANLPRPISPDEGYMRLAEVLALFPVRPTAWWDGVAAGRYPRPVKIGPKINAWRVADIRQLLADTSK